LGPAWAGCCAAAGTGSPPPAKASHPAYDVFNHVALAAASREEIDAWHRRLVENGVETVGPVDHGIIYSIYFHDPNGIRLELAMVWTESTDEVVKSYVNGIPTKSGGTHENGFGSAIVKAVRKMKPNVGMLNPPYSQVEIEQAWGERPQPFFDEAMDRLTSFQERAC